jgi:hypothetical protein
MSDIKDKRIILKGLAYIAEVHWYDGKMTSAGNHATMKAAQRALAKYPDDVFDGYDNPSSDKALAFMEYVRMKNNHKFLSKPRRKHYPAYERLYDRRII